MEIRKAVVEPVGRNANWSSNFRKISGLGNAEQRNFRIIIFSNVLESREVINGSELN